jgi:large subunit ribosomal protein L35
MPKVKTHSGAAKRFKVTGSGKLMFKSVGKRHNLGSMKTKVKKRHMNIDKELFPGEVASVKAMLKLKTGNRRTTYVRKALREAQAAAAAAAPAA